MTSYSLINARALCHIQNRRSYMLKFETATLEAREWGFNLLTCDIRSIPRGRGKSCLLIHSLHHDAPCNRFSRFFAVIGPARYDCLPNHHVKLHVGVLTTLHHLYSINIVKSKLLIMARFSQIKPAFHIPFLSMGSAICTLQDFELGTWIWFIYLYWLSSKLISDVSEITTWETCGDSEFEQNQRKI